MSSRDRFGFVVYAKRQQKDFFEHFKTESAIFGHVRTSYGQGRLNAVEYETL